MNNDALYQRQLWDNALEEYVLTSQIPDAYTFYVEHVGHMKNNSIYQQLLLLGSISNYHWWQYIKCDADSSTHDIHVNSHDHLLYHPSCSSNDDNIRQRYFPKSLRNHLMYYLYHEQLYLGVVHSTSGHLLKVDTGEEIFNQGPTSEPDENVGERPRKGRKYFFIS